MHKTKGRIEKVETTSKMIIDNNKNDFGNALSEKVMGCNGWIFMLDSQLI